MSTKKMIQINPELFKIAGNKTRKVREKKELSLKPVISPNNLKNKLLNRIKEHKARELQGAASTTRSNPSEDADEFTGALNYFSELNKKRQQATALQNRTMRNNRVASTPLDISLELPPELKEQQVFQPSAVAADSAVFNVNYRVDDSVPYGCLKNGKKKTYREWKEFTQDPQIPNLVRPPTPPKKTNVFLEGATQIQQPSESTALTREQRLEQIKHKLKRLQDEETVARKTALKELNIIEAAYKQPVTLNELDEPPSAATTNHSNIDADISEMIKEREISLEKNIPKQYLKTTVKRKFTLGKSDKLRKVSVLIKDKQTRKNIINTQKELKKMNITDVRKYLRQHGIIKVGSTCPADILRKTFETALMTGEVTNTNKEMLLHNFLYSEN
jgi:hypothetical protein